MVTTPFVLLYKRRILNHGTDQGATVTFLLRSPAVFDNDEAIKKYITEGKAHLVKGDALVRADVQAAWGRAAQDKKVDVCIFTLGKHLPTTKYILPENVTFLFFPQVAYLHSP